MFSQSILYIGLAQSLFAAFVLITKKRVAIYDRIMIACLLTFSLKFVMFLLHTEYGEFFDLEISMGLIPLTFGPYVYLYTVYLVDRKPRFDYRDLLHFTPFILSTVAYYAFFKDMVNFTDVTYFKNDRFLAVRVVYAMIFFTSIVAYIALTFVKLRQFRKGLLQHFSYLTRQLKLIWLNFIPSLFGALFIVHFITGGINAFSYEKVIDTATLSHIGLTIIAFAVSYFGVRQPSLFKPVPVKEESNYFPPNETVAANNAEVKTESKIAQSVPVPVLEGMNGIEVAGVFMANEKTGVKEEREASVPPDNYREEPAGNERKEPKHRFTEKRAQELIAKLNKHMEEEKPYLNAELTLYDLASQINLSKNELTDLLNIHIGKNFFSYVNDFRLKAVIKRLENPNYDHYTIIAIAYDCGFNSKSTFNNLFKQFSGLTPSEYKKSKQPEIRKDA